MSRLVHVYGAGSIGNHLTHACRSKGWDVTVIDVDPEALERMRLSIYPSRYGAWDERIQLRVPGQLGSAIADVVIVGTPPDSHLDIAFQVLEAGAPRILLLEKPLCTPDLSECDRLVARAADTGTTVLTGYNHTMVAATEHADRILLSGLLGVPDTLVAEFREHWGGIFSAHPWLRGPADTYLGFWKRGGGASGEHSHAMNIWQHFAHVLGMGRITEVTALLDYVDAGGCHYDRLCQLHVRTEHGLAGSIVQDVVSDPPRKMAWIQGRAGYLEWHVGRRKNEDQVVMGGPGREPETTVFPKTRPDDFRGEIDHLERLLDGHDRPADSPIHLTRGLETMLVVAAAHRSAATGRRVLIDHSRGWTERALEA